jgi:hypothetical protein
MHLELVAEVFSKMVTLSQGTTGFKQLSPTPASLDFAIKTLMAEVGSSVTQTTMKWISRKSMRFMEHFPMAGLAIARIVATIPSTRCSISCTFRIMTLTGQMTVSFSEPRAEDRSWPQTWDGKEILWMMRMEN